MVWDVQAGMRFYKNCLWALHSVDSYARMKKEENEYDNYC